AFDRLFPAGAAPPPGAPREADLIRKARSNVLDLVKREHTAGLPRLGVEDKQKLEPPRDLITEMPTEILGAGSITGAPPARPGVSGDPGGGNALPRTRAFIPLVAAAMACDVSRVAVLVSGQLASADFGGPAGADVHQDIAHQATPGSAAAMHMANYYR